MHRCIQPFIVVVVVVVIRTSGSAMMFAGTSGVDSQMDMMHPMITDFVRALLLPRRTTVNDDRVFAICIHQFADTGFF